MIYEWDGEKNILNKFKHPPFELGHGVGVIEAEDAVEIPASIDGEDRVLAIAEIGGAVMAAVYVPRKNPLRRRIISVRRASRKERKVYYEHCKDDA
ncbi:MAG: BrnT family toxin [Rickettsiales bacterium]|jgi:uncharacterized DUF497 family protein|nr:BrnT family toxin [Rickettsiales bacterium]